MAVFGGRTALEPNRAICFAGLGAALLLGALVRFWNLAGQSLFLDEAFVFDAASRSVHDLLMQIAYHDAHPPLFYLAAHALLAALRWPLENFRYLTAPFGLLTIVATWGLARRLFGDVPAAIAAVVVATEPSLVQLDRLYRMYSILAALAATSWWLLLAAQEARGKQRASMWIAYGICVVVMSAVQYLGWAVVLSQVAWAVLRSPVDRRWPVFASAGACLIALLPWVWALPSQLAQGGYAGASGTQDWWALARGVLAYALPIDWYRAPAFDVTFTLAAAGTFAAGLFLGRGTILPWYAAPIALQAVASIATGKDLLLSRYLLYMVPAFAISLAAVVAALLQTKARVAGLLLLVLVLSVNGAAVTDESIDAFYQLPDWNMVSTIVGRFGRPGDAVVLDQGFPYLIVRTSPSFAGRDTSAPTLPSQIDATIAWIDARARQRIWYVENQYYYPDPQRRVLAHLADTRHRNGEWLEPRADLSNRVYIALYDAVRERKRR